MKAYVYNTKHIKFVFNYNVDTTLPHKQTIKIHSVWMYVLGDEMIIDATRYFKYRLPVKTLDDLRFIENVIEFDVLTELIQLKRIEQSENKYEMLPTQNYTKGKLKHSTYQYCFYVTNTNEGYITLDITDNSKLVKDVPEKSCLDADYNWVESYQRHYKHGVFKINSVDDEGKTVVLSFSSVMTNYDLPPIYFSLPLKQLVNGNIDFGSFENDVDRLINTGMLNGNIRFNFICSLMNYLSRIGIIATYLADEKKLAFCINSQCYRASLDENNFLILEILLSGSTYYSMFITVLDYITASDFYELINHEILNVCE